MSYVTLTVALHCTGAKYQRLSAQPYDMSLQLYSYVHMLLIEAACLLVCVLVCVFV